MSLPQRIHNLLLATGSAGESPVLTAAQPLVVAVSGGPDSLALLHLLARQQLHPADRLIVAHLDHALRPTSAEEAGIVAAIAAEWGLALHTRRVDVAALAQASRQPVEAAARQARYDFLAHVAESAGAVVVATGHTADDQAETVLMHILRGSGTAGLRGMLPAAQLPGHPHLTLIRPLLTTTRAEILAYCQQHRLDPIEDESNSDPSYFRNRVRHELLPLLATYNPQIGERLRDLASVAAADYALLESLATDAWQSVGLSSEPGYSQWERRRWLALPLSLRRATLRLALRQLDPGPAEVSLRAIEQARRIAEAGIVGAQSLLPGGLTLTVGYHSLWLSRGAAPAGDWPQLTDAAPCSLPVPGSLALAAGWRLVAEVLTEGSPETMLSNSNPFQVVLNAGVAQELVVRPRLPGERFQPLGMSGTTTSVKELMIDRKVPAGARQLWPLVANEAHLVWIPGHHLDERAKVTARTERVVALRLLPPAESGPPE
jgi:tRNA(Ile)-lysidine synthase